VPARFLLHDGDAKFCRSFDDVGRSQGGEVLVTPVRAPKANAYAKRWIRTVRADYPRDAGARPRRAGRAGAGWPG
jgi:putative transposase